MEVLVIFLGIWLLMGFWASSVTAKKGRSAGAGWGLGLLLGIIGVVIAYCLTPYREPR